MPETSFSSVVLPEPLRPTRPSASPGATSNETSRSAQTSLVAARPRAIDRVLQGAVGPLRDGESLRDAVDDDLARRHRQPRGCESPLPHDPREDVDEAGVGVRHLDPVELHPELGRLLPRLGVDVPADLQVVGDEPDRTDEDAVGAGVVQRLEVVEDVGPEPRLPGRRLALERERPVGDRGRLRDERGGLEQLVAVGIALGEDPRGQRVRREDDVAVRAPDPVGEEGDEAGVVVPALDELEPRTAGEAPLELVAVAGDRELRVVRREHQADDRVGAACDRPVGRLLDVRRPVLHAGEDREPEPLGQAGARLLGDRVQRVRLLDAEPAVAVDEVVEQLGCDRPAAADIGVVGRDVRQPVRRPVRHQNDRSAHEETLAETRGPAGRQGGSRLPKRRAPERLLTASPRQPRPVRAAPPPSRRGRARRAGRGRRGRCRAGRRGRG